MSRILAPAYASIFMVNFELKYINLYIKDKAKLILRFIDNFFMIWAGTEQELLDFMRDWNKKDPSIKFGLKYS